MLKGKGIISVRYGNLTAQMVLYPHVIRRILGNDLSKKLMDKRLNLMLK